jgi:hypothetical protein
VVVTAVAIDPDVVGELVVEPRPGRRVFEPEVAREILNFVSLTWELNVYCELGYDCTAPPSFVTDADT